MTDDFYCDEVLSGHTPVQRVLETEHVLLSVIRAPFGRYISSSYPSNISITAGAIARDDALVLEMLLVIREVAGQ